MTATVPPLHHYPEDVTLINLNDKTILLAGTAHFFRQSSHLVMRVLDQERYTALLKHNNWVNLDLKQVVRNKQLPPL